MKRYRMIAAVSAFLALLLLKLAFPGLTAALRETVKNARNGQPEVIEVFRDLGHRLSLRAAESPAPAPSETVLSAARAEFISYYVEEGSVGGDRLVAETPEPEPPAVAAFLENQAAFADQTLPENVDYAYVSLPFAYSTPVSGYESSGFGFRLHPILNVVRFHYGTDFAANAGEPISAFADGTVIFAGSDDSFGKHLKIDHGDGWISHYCHCSTQLVSQGDRVTKGQQIALVGATGLATGPHLHFELSHNGVYVNPEYYLEA